MIMNVDVKDVFYGFFNGLYPGIAKFNNLPGIRENYMIVLPVKIRFFVLRQVLSELVFSHQSAFKENFYGVV